MRRQPYIKDEEIRESKTLLSDRAEFEFGTELTPEFRLFYARVFLSTTLSSSVGQTDSPCSLLLSKVPLSSPMN